MKTLNITRFEIVGIYGIDVSCLMEKRSEEYFNSIRGNPAWLHKLKAKVTDPNRFGFTYPEFAESRYAKTDRVIRNTFSIYYINNLMPLVFRLNKEDILYDELFNIEILSASINSNGAITIKIKACKENSTVTSIKDIIDACYKYKKGFHEKINLLIIQFIELLSDCITELEIEKIPLNKFEQYLNYYEIIDFDYDTNETEKVKIKSMYKDEFYIKSLAALFRMSKTDFYNYDVSMISDIRHNDCGNRIDELWAINQDRLLRYHTYAKTDKYIECFFSDIILGTEILLQQKIVLQYINQWISIKRFNLREMVNINPRGLEVDNEKIVQLIFEMVNIYDVVSDGFLIQKNTNHTFFNLIIEKIIENMRLEKMHNSGRVIISDLFSLLTSISSQISTNTSINFDNLNFELSKSMGRINSFVWKITLLMAIVAILQLALTIFSFFKLL